MACNCLGPPCRAGALSYPPPPAADVEVILLLTVNKRKVSATKLMCNQGRFVMCSALRLLLILHTSD